MRSTPEICLPTKLHAHTGGLTIVACTALVVLFYHYIISSRLLWWLCSDVHVLIVITLKLTQSCTNKLAWEHFLPFIKAGEVERNEWPDSKVADHLLI